jgi:hypothetical protein
MSTRLIGIHFLTHTPRHPCGRIKQDSRSSLLLVNGYLYQIGCLTYPWNCSASNKDDKLVQYLGLNQGRTLNNDKCSEGEHGYQSHKIPVGDAAIYNVESPRATPALPLLSSKWYLEPRHKGSSTTLGHPPPGRSDKMHVKPTHHRVYFKSWLTSI